MAAAATNIGFLDCHIRSHLLAIWPRWFITWFITWELLFCWSMLLMLALTSTAVSVWVAHGMVVHAG